MASLGLMVDFFFPATPNRIFRLTTKTLRDAPVGISGLSNHVSNLSRKEILRQLFPYYNKIASTRHFIRSEVSHKRSKLIAFKKLQAARLGLLMQKKPQIDPQSDLDTAYKQVNASLNLLTNVLDQILESKIERGNFNDDHIDILLSRWWIWGSSM